MRKQFGVSADEVYQLDFLDVAVLKRSTKGTMTCSFHIHTFHSLLSAEK